MGRLHEGGDELVIREDIWWKRLGFALVVFVPLACWSLLLLLVNWMLL